MRILINLVLLLVMIYSAGLAQQATSRIYPFAIEYDPERNLIVSFPTPAGYERFPTSKMTRYMAWLTNLPLKPKYHPLIRWDKQIIYRADSIAAVIDLSVTTNNQKDEDFPMQVALEYAKSTNLLEDFPILLTDRDTLTYSRWMNGSYSFDARGNILYKRGEPRQQSEKEFYRFLEFIIRHNTHETLLKNLEPVKGNQVIPGDIFIQFNKDDPDSTGHAALVLDVCINKEGEIILLMAWGGNPAQSYHIPRNWINKNSNWFTVDELKEQLSEYGEGKFYRFTRLLNL